MRGGPAAVGSVAGGGRGSAVEASAWEPVHGAEVEASGRRAIWRLEEEPRPRIPTQAVHSGTSLTCGRRFG